VRVEWGVEGGYNSFSNFLFLRHLPFYLCVCSSSVRVCDFVLSILVDHGPDVIP